MDIEMERVCKSYGEKRVLRDFSAMLKDGGIYVVTGASGTGKTTLLHLLCGLLLPDSGSITGGVRYGVVFQENRLLPHTSALENLLLVAQRNDREQTVSDFLAEILPSDSLTQPVEALSGGMQRRAAIARAMLPQSDCILMDEPFTGLDEGTADTVLAFIMRHRCGRTLVISTHQPSLLAQYETQHIAL